MSCRTDGVPSVSCVSGFSPKREPANQDAAEARRGEKRGVSVKEGIHPKYYEAKVTCGCGNTFTTGSTKQELRVDVCSKCHPFFTGRLRGQAKGGRIERFKQRYKKD